jgi:hypothetical protein
MIPARITARNIRITVILDTAAVMAALQRFEHSNERTPIVVTVAGRTLKADFPPRAVRRALATIREHGADDTVVLVQGKLGQGDSIEEAGLVAQAKVKKPEAAAA